MHGEHGHWQLFGALVDGIKVDVAGGRVGPTCGNVESGGRMEVEGEPVISLPSQSRHIFGQGLGIGLAGEPLHNGLNSSGWTQR